MPSLRDRILLALRRLETPPGAAWSLDGDRLRRLECREGRLALEIAVDSLEQKADLDGLARAIERALLPIGGVDSVETRFCLREAPAEGDAHSPAVRFGAVVAVASAKGGVGKTTVAVRLAEALAARGRRIGLLDADLQGPNVPQMTGLRATLGVNEAANRIVPAVWRGVKIASMGLLLKETEPAVWRGPMLHSALRQLLRDVEWGDLDCLIVDLPPGTGDAALALFELIRANGCLLVTTPHLAAARDTQRFSAMLALLNVPILGVVENMSWIECPHGGRLHPFGPPGAGRALAEGLDAPFFGEIPLSAEFAAPPAEDRSDSRFADLAGRLIEAMRDGGSA